MTEVHIRGAELDDAASIAAHIKTMNSADEVRSQIELLLERRADGWQHLVAIDRGTVVGNVVIMPTRHFPQGQPHRAELADIVIAPSHQGSGLLGELIEAAVEQAKAMGVTQLETSAWASNPRACAAYTKVGFREWGRLPAARRNPDGIEDELVCLYRPV
ncbi:MAG TPA: GNAT family N-acetyltransferase [Fimbriimonadaceae bacterium]|jgi:GNAT superfamily N-acetyltransferase|nr:GNAT family N-acetyltransferase [Fimbriimonadaceae bacterium]